MSKESERKAAINGGHKCGRALFHLLEIHGIEKPSDIAGIPDGILPEHLGRLCIHIPYQKKIIDYSLWKELQCIGMIAAGAAILPDFSFDHEGIHPWIRTLFGKNSKVAKGESYQRYNKKIVEVSGRLRKLRDIAHTSRERSTPSKARHTSRSEDTPTPKECGCPGS
jgi:hypothetical protein